MRGSIRAAMPYCGWADAASEAAMFRSTWSNRERELAMITLDQPSMALNAENVPGPDYHMWNTWRVSSAEAPAHILDWVATVATTAPGGTLNALVFNCHGSPAHLSLGTGFGWAQIPFFSSLSGLVNDIYLVACEVVSFSGPGDGNLFCGAIAKAAQANVYASNATQNTGLWPWIPYGQIDGFEGNVWKWHPDGSNELTNL